MLPRGVYQGPAGDTQPAGRVPRAPLVGRQAPSCEGVSGRLKAWRLESPPGAPSPTLRAHFARPCDSLGAGGRGTEQAFEGSLHVCQADCVSPEARPSMGGSLW